MKKSLLALAVLGAFASAASAQSSVTLSGIVDAGVRRVGTATGYDWNMAPSQSGYAAFTLSGREDLGGGMAAFFTLNHRFRIQNGTVASEQNLCAGSANVLNTTAPCGLNQVFWRNAWVGLAGGFGDVRLGRILMPLQDMNGGFDAFDTGYVASTHTGGITATIRAQNAVYYRSPNMGGLTVHAAIAAGEGQVQGETANNVSSIVPNTKLSPGGVGERPMGFSLRYAAGPLNVGVAYDRNFADYTTTGVYGSYDMGVAKLNFQFEKGDSNIGATGPKEDMQAMSVSARIPLGKVIGKVGYVRFNSNLANRDASKFGVGGEYVLSKRTSLYSNVGKSSGNRLAAAAKKAAFDIGVTHRF